MIVFVVGCCYFFAFKIFSSYIIYFLFILLRLALNAREQLNKQNCMKNEWKHNSNSSSSNFNILAFSNNNDKKTQQETKKLLKEIESIKPDYEQRKLAVEVNIVFILTSYC